MKEEKKQATSIFSGNDTIKLVKQLIRYDVPFIMLGISSIGKSYSILDMAKRWRMPHSILYIGSEKPSNIEGLPRLVGKRSESGDILEFFKPNWFPNSLLISKYVTSGKEVFERYIDTAYNGNKKSALEGTDFKVLNEIFEGIFQWKWESNTTETQDMALPKIGTAKDVLNKPFKVHRQLLDEKELFVKTTEDPNFMQKDEVRDLSLYLSTILGYGNFWLVLDELDKVDENEQDKYAPLLHIVRERIIKNFSMRTLNEGEGAGVPMKVDSGSYKTIKKDIDESIKNQYPLLDTRILGIANATANIEEALFRRFLHIIIEDVMMVSEPPKQLSAMRNCLEEVTESQTQGENQFLANLEFRLLAEVNLQWQYNFFPKIVNRNDGQNNFFIKNLQTSLSSVGGKYNFEEKLNDDFSAASAQLVNLASDTALFKVIRNNYGMDDEMGGSFSTNFQGQIYGCLVKEVLNQGGSAERIVTKGAKAADVGSEKLTKDANAELIEEALELNDNDALKAAEYLIAQNISDFNGMEQNNASVQDYVTNTLQLIESSQKTDLSNNLFTGLLANAYAGVLFSKNSFDYKLANSTYLNQFSLLAQQDGFSYTEADSSVIEQAKKTLQLEVDTLTLVEDGKGSKIDNFNKEISMTAALRVKRELEVNSNKRLGAIAQKFGLLFKRGLDVHYDAFNEMFSEEVKKGFEEMGLKNDLQPKRYN